MNDNTGSEEQRCFRLRLFPTEQKEEQARELLTSNTSTGIIEPSRTRRWDYWLRIGGTMIPAVSHEALDMALQAGGTLLQEAELGVDHRGRLVAKVHVTLTQKKDRIIRHENTSR